MFTAAKSLYTSNNMEKKEKKRSYVSQMNIFPDIMRVKEYRFLFPSVGKGRMSWLAPASSSLQ